jgi:DNA-directed RNA polymerase specialized sigma24 family protein
LDQDSHSHSGFRTTHWSVVSVAGDAGSPLAQAALETLCARYWYPIYAQIRRCGHSPHDAQDLAQEFFALLLRRQSIAAADRNKGRFRTYLLGALKYFLLDQRDHRSTQKRGGQCEIISLDADQAEQWLNHEDERVASPEREFDRRWSITLLDRAFRRLEEEYAAHGKAALFAELKPFLAHQSESGAYAAPAQRVGLTASAFGVAVHRFRARYRELLKAEVADTLANPANVDEELRQLFL